MQTPITDDHAVLHRPALLVSACGSNNGKTAVAAGLARLYREQGHRVRAFKVGPDFLDPMILESATGAPVYQLDLWMGGAQDIQRLLYRGAADADVVIVEGAMGLFDGAPSSADLAQSFNVPILAVIDARGTAQTLGAVALGLHEFRRDVLKFDGVIANNVMSPRHDQMIREGMPASVRFRGGLPFDSSFSLPSRHLGLHQASEIGDLDARLSGLAGKLREKTTLAELPQHVEFRPSTRQPLERALKGLRIGIARDAAFSFLYRANVELLQELGAELLYFSPLLDRELPPVDSLYFPGGYPELHLPALEANVSMKEAIEAHALLGKSIYAECGGLLYLMESLVSKTGEAGAMVGLLPGRAVMQSRLQSLGHQELSTPSGPLRGHTFHYSKLDSPLTPISFAQKANGGERGEAVFVHGPVTASYVHCYFPSNPAAAAAFFRPH